MGVETNKITRIEIVNLMRIKTSKEGSQENKNEKKANVYGYSWLITRFRGKVVGKEIGE